MNTSAKSAVAPRAVSGGGVAVLGPSAAADIAEVLIIRSRALQAGEHVSVASTSGGVKKYV